MKSYFELMKHEGFLNRFRYLKLTGDVGAETFGSERYLNQKFYTSREWRQTRNKVIVRDQGFDLGCEDRPIFGKIIIHHINPLNPADIIHGRDALFDLDNLICVSHLTHNALHYGDESLLPQPYVERRPGDTTLW